jgi:DNA-directed RNA polymerase specialized sigma24 family protein
MSAAGDVTSLIGRIRAGDPGAAQGLWERYFQRLVVLARVKLRGRRRVDRDEEDVALSAFDSFCRAAGRGRFPRLDDRDDLWQVLAVLTCRKVADLVEYWKRQKRLAECGESALGAPEGGTGAGRAIEQVAGRGPTPAEAAELTEGCRRLLSLLKEEALRQIATLKLEGYSNEEVAERLGCSVATVERKLKRIRRLWKDQGRG